MRGLASRAQLLLAVRSLLGPRIVAALKDETVTDVLLLHSLEVLACRNGRYEVIGRLTESEAESLVRLLATLIGKPLDGAHPEAHGYLAELSQRVQLVTAPRASTPVLAFRRGASRVPTLAEYVAQGRASPEQLRVLTHAFERRATVLVAGATGAGKTTFVRACLREPVFMARRIVVLEDTPELHLDRVGHPNWTALFAERVNAELIRVALRLNPDCLLPGEIRDGTAAQAALLAWGSGHPGGLSTVHGNSAEDALHQLAAYLEPVTHALPLRQIARAVQLVVFLEARNGAPRLSTVAEVKSLDAHGEFVLAHERLDDSASVPSEEKTP